MGQTMRATLDRARDAPDTAIEEPRMIPRSIDRYASLFTERTELRMQENRSTSITVVDGTVMGNSQNAESGVSARVWRSGAWGFASSPELGSEAVGTVIQAATENALFLDTPRQGLAVPEVS